MADLMDLLKSQLTDGMVDQLSQQLGGVDKQQTATAASSIFSTVLAGLAKNAGSKEGAASLATALEKDHDGGILDNFTEMLSGTAEPVNQRSMNGSGILKHVLGEKQSGVVDMISKMSGLGGDKTGSLMSMLAPMILGTLGKQKKQSGMGIEDLAGYLNGSVKKAQTEKADEMGMIGKLLDRDGDGSYMDDVAGMGMNILGNLFKK